jgi:two-component system, chemotaxis family, chemotaxis protein CheY
MKRVHIPPSVLSADDSPSMRQMISFTLSSAGFDVVEAVDGRDALAKATNVRFRVVITDKNMPHMDGLELARMLRELENYKETPILMLTTESGDEAKQAAREAGVTGWMVKPFHPERLVELIQKLAT